MHFILLFIFSHFKSFLLGLGVNENTKVFLLTYRKFLSSPNLLAYTIRAYTQLDPRASATATKVKRLRICNFLKNWLEKYYHDFEGDTHMIETYREFVTNAVLANEGERLSNQVCTHIHACTHGHSSRMHLRMHTRT